MRLGDLLHDLGRSIAYHSGLARALGSIPAALMLTQLVYWSDKSSDGWVWKVEQDWDDELALTPEQVKGGRAVLVKLGLIEHRRAGMPAKPYYRVNFEVLEPWWEATFPTVLSGENARTSPGKMPEQDGGFPPDTLLLHRDDRIDDSHSAAFDRFWEVYPRKEAKGAARKAWDKARKKAPAQTILIGAGRYAADPNRDPAYTAHPSTWLNGERWGDPPLPARRGGKTAHLPPSDRALAEDPDYWKDRS